MAVMLSLRSERQLAQFFLDIAKGEERVEDLRQSLALIPAFTPATVFARMDRRGAGSIDSGDLVRYLESLGLMLRESEAKQILQQYDSNQDGLLSENDFLQFALPAANPGLRTLAMERRYGSYTAEVQVVVTRLMEVELAYQRNLGDDLRDIRGEEGFTISAAFNAATLPLSTYITRSSIRSLLSKHSSSVSDSLLDGIFRRLDNDGDEQLSYLEFSAPFLAFSPSTSLRVSSPNRSFRSLRSSSGLENTAGNRSFRSPERDVKLESRSFRSPARSFRAAENSTSLSQSFRSSRSYKPAESYRESSSSLSRRYSPYSSYKSLSSSRPASSTATGISPTVRSALAAYFQAYIDLGRETETKRRDLTLDYDFDLERAFKVFDRFEKGYVTERDIEEGLAALGVAVRRGDMTLLLAEFSSSGYGRLSYSDFCEMILPEGANRYSSLSRYSTERRSSFRALTRSRLADLMQIMIEKMRRIEGQRQALQRLPSFTPTSTFASLDIDRNDYLTASELRFFLQSEGVRASELELSRLLAVLDRDKDGRVTGREFAASLVPKARDRYY